MFCKIFDLLTFLIFGIFVAFRMNFSKHLMPMDAFFIIIILLFAIDIWLFHKYKVNKDLDVYYQGIRILLGGGPILIMSLVLFT